MDLYAAVVLLIWLTFVATLLIPEAKKSAVRKYLPLILALTAIFFMPVIGLVVNNNASAPTEALTGWTGWFSSVVALVAAILALLEAAPKLAAAIKDRAAARLMDAEARLWQRKTAAIRAYEAAIRSGVTAETLESILDNDRPAG